MLMKNQMSYNDIKSRVKASPNTIVSRLREFEKLGIIRSSIRTVGNRKRIEYKLTLKGKEIAKISSQIGQLNQKIQEILGENID